MDYLHPKLDDAAIARMSSLALAHVGDAVYEILVRTHLACGGTQTAKNLHSQTITLVRASAQAKAIEHILPDLTEEEENAVILKEIKQCQEAIDTAPAGRDDVLAENTARIAVYQEFAPKMMDEAEITAVLDAVLAELNITAPTAKDKGLIMKTLMPRVKGKADSALVNKVLTAKMNG